MKIILSLLAAMLILPAATARAEAGQGASMVNVLGPLSMANNGDLDFGAVTLTAGAGGTVTVNANTDALTTTGGMTAAGGVPRAAEFIAYAPSSFLLTAVVPPNVTLTRAGGTQQLNLATTIDSGWFNFFGARVRFPPAGGITPLRIGGTLTVPNNAVEGTYTGNYTVTINFY